MADLLKKITWYRGDSYPIELLIKDKATENAITLTGYTFLLTVGTLEDPPDDTTKLFEVAGVLDPDQVTNKGIVRFTPTAVQTNQTPAEYYYDLQMTDASGNIRTIVKKPWIMTQDITK